MSDYNINSENGIFCHWLKKHTIFKTSKNMAPLGPKRWLSWSDQIYRLRYKFWFFYFLIFFTKNQHFQQLKKTAHAKWPTKSASWRQPSARLQYKFCKNKKIYLFSKNAIFKFNKTAQLKWLAEKVSRRQPSARLQYKFWKKWKNTFFSKKMYLSKSTRQRS